jgi:hypothetical protein
VPGRVLSDQHASGPYRVHLARVLARRALERAVERAASVPVSCPPVPGTTSSAETRT